jgi:transcriptional regulator with XRE-family HTH domain
MVRLRVREIAEQKGISRGKLSRLSDLSYPTIRDIWNDPYRDVSVSTLEKLAKALGISTAALIEDVPEDNDKAKRW